MSNEQLWQAALGELELILSRANFTTWFKNTFIVNSEGGKIIIGVPNTFTKTWLEKKYHDPIISALQNVLEENLQGITYRVESKKPTVSSSRPPITTIPEPPSAPTYNCGLNERYRLETFIVGKGNELAHAAAHAVANNPGKSYNPLFIYGGVGLGKTHLLQGVGLKLLEEKKARILYVTSERFTNDYIQSVRAGGAREFKDRYRSVDVLLIDDIQFIAGKEGTQEEFFHTFNTLHQNNKQIILTSDRPPKAIPALEQRLLSRFEWGMIADISQPDLETRIAILQAKCKEKKVNLEKDVLQYLASTAQHNIRELEGSLNRIIAEHEFNGLDLTLEGVKKIFMAAAESSTPRQKVSPKRLVETVCRYYSITEPELKGKSRKRELVIPRQIIMYLMREETQASFPSIGHEIGSRDHTTVMHACGKIKEAVETDEKIRQDVMLLKQQIYVN